MGNGIPEDWANYYGISACPSYTQSFTIVGHEIAHGVTRHTSDLVYAYESGALNEAFSDILGVSAEFFHQEKRSGTPYPVNYQIGEERTPGRPNRDMANPASVYWFKDLEALSYPPHYGSRWLVNDDRELTDQDNGWVHMNSSIVNHAFYLAIEGGEGDFRPGPTVQGVGASNRSDVEEAFYQAFAYHLTPYAQMRDARYWTIEEAPTSASRVAIAEAWDAVGVYANQQVVVEFRDFSFPCSDGQEFGFEIHIRTGETGFDVTSLYLDIHSAFENAHVRDTTLSPSSVADFFGTSQIPPYTWVAASLCWAAAGGVDFSLEADLTGTHSDGEVVTHHSGRWQSFLNYD
jgi:hypothetical protein